MPVPPIAAASFGAQLGQGAAQSGVSGLISGGLGQLFGGMNARRQWKFTQKQMALQQKYALEQMAKQAEYEYGNWQKQFDYENKYNDPSAVFDRYRLAGINPAAVLGSSGVGINATMSGGSGGSIGASGPSGSFSAPGVGPLDMTSVGQNMASQSVVERNDAAAQRDRAEADDIRSKMQAPDYYKAVAALNKDILKHNVDNASAVSDMNRALATIYQADAEYADLAATYKFQDFVAQYSTHVEEYNQIRKYNVEYMDKLYAAQIILDYARAYESFRSGELLSSEKKLTDIRVKDLQNWFDINWETNIPIPEVDEKGKPTGKVFRATGRDIFANILGMTIPAAKQDLAGKWFQNRSEKNALGYQMANTALRGAAAAASAYAGAKGLSMPITTTSEESREHYNEDGEYVGGTMVSRRSFRSRR